MNVDTGTFAAIEARVSHLEARLRGYDKAFAQFAEPSDPEPWTRDQVHVIDGQAEPGRHRAPARRPWLALVRPESTA